MQGLWCWTDFWQCLTVGLSDAFGFWLLHHPNDEFLFFVKFGTALTQSCNNRSTGLIVSASYRQRATWCLLVPCVYQRQRGNITSLWESSVWTLCLWCEELAASSCTIQKSIHKHTTANHTRFPHYLDYLCRFSPSFSSEIWSQYDNKVLSTGWLHTATDVFHPFAQCWPIRTYSLIAEHAGV